MSGFNGFTQMIAAGSKRRDKERMTPSPEALKQLLDRYNEIKRENSGKSNTSCGNNHTSKG